MTRKTKKQQAYEDIVVAARDLLYELAPGIHTYSACTCGHSRTRSGKCWRCVIDTLVSRSMVLHIKQMDMLNGMATSGRPNHTQTPRKPEVPHDAP